MVYCQDRLGTNVRAVGLKRKAFRFVNTGAVSEAITMARMPQLLNIEYGAPSQVWLHVKGGAKADVLSLDVSLINKTATRFAEAAFVTFDPVQGSGGSGSGWAMDKLGRWISPLAVADGGSMGLSPVNTGILYSKGGGGGGGSSSSSAGGSGAGTATTSSTPSQAAEAKQQRPSSSSPSVFFRTMDAAVVKFGEKVPFPTPIHGSADMSQGTHFLLWDNYWNTNYVFWWPYETKPGCNSDNVLFRFAIELLSY